jgi:hypothetical protein
MLPMVIKLTPKPKMKASPVMKRTQLTFPDNHTWGLYWFPKENGRLWREHHGRLTAYCGHSSGEFLCPPSNDETLVQMMLFLFR